MFDDITRSEASGGLRGFIYRHFGPVENTEVSRHAHKAEVVGTSIALACATALLLLWAVVGMFLSLGPCGFSEMPRWWRACLFVIPAISVPAGLYAWNRYLVRDTSAGVGPAS